MEETLANIELSATIRELETKFKEQMAMVDHSDSIQKIMIAEQSFRAELEEVQKQLIEFAANFDNPDSISKEHRKILIESHRKWGKFGWTWIPIETLNFYDDPPVDANDAYERVKLYCFPRYADLLFDDLRKTDINKSDLKSAIFCFQNQQYKACSLLLFGIIDAELIYKMPKSCKAGNRRPSGIGAINALKRNEESKRQLSLLLHGVNLFSCLETFFANGNDFEDEPAIINRNFIAHGMNKREVCQQDCVQLFLALYNLTHFLKLYKSEK